jgi:hypothetical protein
VKVKYLISFYIVGYLLEPIVAIWQFLLLFLQNLELFPPPPPPPPIFLFFVTMLSSFNVHFDIRGAMST